MECRSGGRHRTTQIVAQRDAEALELTARKARLGGIGRE
jgi:hypothetical protein